MVVLRSEMKIKQQNWLYLHPFLGSEFCADGVVTGVDVTMTVLVCPVLELAAEAGTDSDTADDAWVVNREPVDDGAEADDDVAAGDVNVNDVVADDDVAVDDANVTDVVAGDEVDELVDEIVDKLVDGTVNEWVADDRDDEVPVDGGEVNEGTTADKDVAQEADEVTLVGGLEEEEPVW